MGNRFYELRIPEVIVALKELITFYSITRNAEKANSLWQDAKGILRGSADVIEFGRRLERGF